MRSGGILLFVFTWLCTKLDGEARLPIGSNISNAPSQPAAGIDNSIGNSSSIDNSTSIIQSVPVPNGTTTLAQNLTSTSVDPQTEARNSSTSEPTTSPVPSSSTSNTSTTFFSTSASPSSSSTSPLTSPLTSPSTSRVTSPSTSPVTPPLTWPTATSTATETSPIATKTKTPTVSPVIITQPFDIVFNTPTQPVAPTGPMSTRAVESSGTAKETETLSIVIASTLVGIAVLLISIGFVVFLLLRRRKRHRKPMVVGSNVGLPGVKRIRSKVMADMLADTTQTVRVFECVKYVSGREEECETIKRLLVDFTRDSGQHEAETKQLLDKKKAGFLHGQRYFDVPILKDTAILDAEDNKLELVPKDTISAPSYAHAPSLGGNYISDFNGEKRYIMTEAPKPENMQAFLRCLVRDNVKVVVAIGTDVDVTRGRIHPYFKSGEDNGEGDLSLDHTNEPLLQNSVIEVRAMVVTSESGATRDHMFHHLLYKDWQDHKTANDYKHIAYIKSFTDKYLAEHQYEEAKLLTHCSAGVGRSGTLLAAFLCIDVVKEGHTEINIPAIVKHLRNYRLGTVRRKDQFETLFKVVGVESESHKRKHLEILNDVHSRYQGQAAPKETKEIKKEEKELSTTQTQNESMFKTVLGDKKTRKEKKEKKLAKKKTRKKRRPSIINTNRKKSKDTGPSPAPSATGVRKKHPVSQSPMFNAQSVPMYDLSKSNEE